MNMLFGKSSGMTQFLDEYAHYFNILLQMPLLQRLLQFFISLITFTVLQIQARCTMDFWFPLEFCFNLYLQHLDLLKLNEMACILRYDLCTVMRLTDAVRRYTVHCVSPHTKLHDTWQC